MNIITRDKKKKKTQTWMENWPLSAKYTHAEKKSTEIKHESHYPGYVCFTLSLGLGLSSDMLI